MTIESSSIQVVHMKNCLIFGSGRSGTSMVGGILHDAGYFMGEDLYPARGSNPKGFFENDYINGINEQILKSYDLKKGLLHRLFSTRTSIQSPGKGQHWLSAIPIDVDIDTENVNVINDIKMACDVKVFAYKDPRFSYTLPVWEKYLPQDTVYIVVYREPSVCVSSIVKECEEIDYLKNMDITRNDAYQSWILNYSHILKNYKDRAGRYFFVHYDQILSGEKIKAMSDFLSVEVASGFVDGSLMRSKPLSDVPQSVSEMYGHLNALSGYSA
jgi:hypothetical protein